MRAERKRQIREAVLHDMAPAYAGQVSLEDVSRTFRGRGGLKEVEECLNDLVNEGLARKTEVSGRPYYLFEAIARDAATQNERRVARIGTELESLLERMNKLEHLMEEERSALDRIRPIWFEEWDTSGLGMEAISRIQSYVSLVINNPLQDHRREVATLQAKITELRTEKERRSRSKEETFIPLPASG